MNKDEKVSELRLQLVLQQAALDTLLRAVAEAYEVLDMTRFHLDTQAAGVSTKLTDRGVNRAVARAAFRIRATTKTVCAATGWDYQRAVERPKWG